MSRLVHISEFGESQLCNDFNLCIIAVSLEGLTVVAVDCYRLLGMRCVCLSHVDLSSGNSSAASTWSAFRILEQFGPGRL